MTFLSAFQVDGPLPAVEGAGHALFRRIDALRFHLAEHELSTSQRKF